MNIQTKLGHLCWFHEDRNASELKFVASEVERLIGRLPGFSGLLVTRAKEWIEEYRKLGWDGIVKGPVRTREARGPKLTTLGEDQVEVCHIRLICSLIQCSHTFGSFNEPR